jgi:methanogenic corrinoid protein MtbC1
MEHTTALEGYFRSVSDVDVGAASDLILELFDEGMPVGEITRGVLGPAQVQVGQMWEQGTWSVADEHAATAVTESALAALTHAAAPPRGTAAERHLLMACVEGEWHTLPARMAAAVAAADGSVRVTVLGPSLPADQLGRRLASGDVDVLALSCTLPTNLIGAARCIAAAHEAEVPVVVGGRAFGTTPQRAYAIGADAWAEDPAVLQSTLVELIGRSCNVSTQALLLDGIDDGLITLAFDRLVAAFPRLAQMTPWQQERTREDLRWMARHAAAALLTDDPSVVDELFAWLTRLLGDRVPATVIATSAHLLADTVEPDAPQGAAVLRHAAAALEQQ